MLTSLIISELTASVPTLFFCISTQFWVSIQTNYVAKMKKKAKNKIANESTNAATAIYCDETAQYLSSAHRLKKKEIK